MAINLLLFCFPNPFSFLFVETDEAAYYGDGSLRTIQWSSVVGNFQFNYRLNGQYSSIVFPNGQHRDYTYDYQGRLTQFGKSSSDYWKSRYLFLPLRHQPLPGQSTMLGQRTNLIANVPAQGFVNSETKYYYDANISLPAPIIRMSLRSTAKFINGLMMQSETGSQKP